MLATTVTFPKYSNTRCLMMPYIQGDPDSIPDSYSVYREIVKTVFLTPGEVGFLTIDESPVVRGKPHRGARAKYERALHTEAGKRHTIYGWGTYPPGWGGSVPTWGGSPSWGGGYKVTLDPDVEILLANNLSDSCALWEAEFRDTSEDGDIGYAAEQYPYEDATLMKSGEVHRIGIFTPHESLPVDKDFNRQFLRIVGSGVYGREEYFTENPLLTGSVR